MPCIHKLQILFSSKNTTMSLMLPLLLCVLRNSNFTIRGSKTTIIMVHVILNIRCGYLSCNIATTTSQEVCRISVSISQVTLILLMYYLISHRKPHTQPHCTILKCNGGAARTHVCNQINYIIIVF